MRIAGQQRQVQFHVFAIQHCIVVERQLVLPVRSSLRKYVDLLPLGVIGQARRPR